MNAILFEQLETEYKTASQRLNNVDGDVDFLKNAIHSRASAYWNCGRPMGETGWVEVGTFHHHAREGGGWTHFVCTDAFYKKVQE